MNKGTLVIRADASSRIGAGHLMRCFALAQAWQSDGGHVVFLSYCEQDAQRQNIADAGMKIIHIDYPHPDPRDLTESLNVLQECVETKNEIPVWLVLDGYHFDPVYQQAIRAAGYRIFVIDDEANLTAYHADLLLNQNLGAEKIRYDCDLDTTVLLGSRYALLRQEYLSWRGWSRKISKVASRVLVTLGGGDHDNVTLKIIHAIEKIQISGIEAIVVVGGSNLYYEIIQSEIQDRHLKIRILRNVQNMAELMAWADVAITAGGSTCLETAFMGLPSLVVVLMENQCSNAQNMEAAGAAINLGGHTSIEVDDIAFQLRSLIFSYDCRRNMSDCGRQIVDGLGKMRVIQRLRGDGLFLRPVQPNDCRLIWEWANDPVARTQSFSPEKILWDNHIAWFNSTIENSSIRFFIAEDNNSIPVGQIRYNLNEKEALVSVSLAPEQRGKGYGVEIIRQGTRELWASTNIITIHAYIKRENTASIRAFEKAGFVSEGIAEIKGGSALHLILRKL